MIAVRYKHKFSCLFGRLTEPGAELDSHHMDSLLALFGSDSDAEILIGSPFFSDQVLETLKEAEIYSTTVQIFLIKLTGIIIRNELQFTKVAFLKGMEKVRKIADFSDIKKSPKVILAFVEMSLNLSHSSGMMWLQETSAWKQIYNLISQNQCFSIKRRALEFIHMYLWNLSDVENENELLVALNYILEPIMCSPYHNTEEVTVDAESSWATDIIPVLETLYELLRYKNKIKQPNLLIITILDRYNLYINILNVLRKTRNGDLTFHLCKVHQFLSAAKLLSLRPAATNEDYITEIIDYYRVIDHLINSRMTFTLLEICRTAYTNWTNVATHILSHTYTKYDRTFQIQNQVIVLPLVPLFVFISELVHSTTWKEYFNEFTFKLSGQYCEHTTRACYNFRKLLIQENEPKKYVIEALKHLFVFKKDLTINQASLICQLLIYLFDMYVTDRVDEQGNLVVLAEKLTNEDLTIFNLDIELIHMFLKEYDIKWHDCYDLTCLYNKIKNILKSYVMPSKFVMRALDVISLTMRKFLHPNLALMSDMRDISGLTEVSELIMTFVHDGRWEVQDSALQLLLACTEIAYMKYMPLQDILRNDNLMVMAASLVFGETEFYVQVSGLQCLGSATKIQSVWDSMLQHCPDFYDQLADKLENYPEATVRKGIITLWMDIIDNHPKLSPNLQHKLRNTMVSAALDDLHWEVQLRALDFWRKTINSRFTYYGMIDGSFPSITFSQENHKIVKLDDNEIQRRLGKILNELAAMGCLKSLYSNLSDEAHLEVLQMALKISRDLLKVLDNYKVSQIPEVSALDSDIDVIEDIEIHKGVSPAICEEVLNSIMETEDFELLGNRMSIDIYEETNEKSLKCHYVEPNVFINALKTVDYDNIIEGKIKWNKGVTNFNELIDEILELSSIGSVNEVGCCE